MVTKPTSVFISDGTALPTAGSSITTITANKIGVVDKSMNELTPGNTISDSDVIYLAGMNSVSDLKRSASISGRKITGWKAESYSPASREVWSIGYNRKTASGLIEVNNSVNYTFALTATHAKNLYSERPLYFRRTFLSEASNSQLKTAVQIFNAVNNDPAWSKLVSAIIVGDGTGAPSVTVNGTAYTVYGGTGATNYGVEITGKTLTQFSTDYLEQRVSFFASVDDNTGFGTTTTTANLNAQAMGTGTYQWVYNAENTALNYEGVLNRVKFPIPVQTYQASNTFVNSAAVAQTVTGTSGEDTVTFSAAITSILVPGDQVVFGSTNYEIKYFISSTVAVLFVPLSTSPAAATVKKRFQYDVLNIEFTPESFNSDVTKTHIENVVVIVVPSIDSGGAYNSLSTAGSGLLATLNPYMASLGFANVSI